MPGVIAWVVVVGGLWYLSVQILGSQDGHIPGCELGWMPVRARRVLGVSVTATAIAATVFLPSLVHAAYPNLAS